MNHNDTLYQITKLTQTALKHVEAGLSPVHQYQQIVKTIEGNDMYCAKAKLLKAMKTYILLLLTITCFVTALFYGFRGIGNIVVTERFWPGFGHVLFSCFLGSTGLFCAMNN